MIGIILASFLGVVATEYFFQSPFIPQVKALLNILKKSIRVVSSSRISDHWKEIASIYYAQKLMKSTILLSLMLFGVLGLVYVGALFFDWWIEPEPTTMDALRNQWWWVGMSLGSAVYIYFRNYFVKN